MASLADLVTELQPVLLAAVGANESDRRQAETQLKKAEEGNLTIYLRALAATLANNEGDASQRHIAGICFKNAIKGNLGSSIDRAKRLRYQQLDLPAKQELRLGLLNTLATTDEMAISRIAAQCISAVTRVDLAPSGGGWPDLVPTLITLFDTNQQSSLIAMSYIIEDIYLLQEDEPPTDGTQMLSPEAVNQLLQPLVRSCQDTNIEVRIAALEGCYHVLAVCQENMKNETEQRAIIGAITTNLASSHPSEVQQAAWDACVQLATQYYDILGNYISELFHLSLEAIKSDEEALAIAAVEFWSTICDYELYLHEENTKENDLRLIDQAKNSLVPAFCEKIVKQDEEEDDQWTLSMAVSTCLSLTAQVLGDSILDVPDASGQQTWVIQLFAGFASPEWRMREASLMAFGSILEGPSSQRIQPLIQQALPAIVQTLRDESSAVRETSAWVVGRVAQFHPHVVLPLLPEGLMSMLLEQLQDQPKVATYVCYFFHELADYIVEKNAMNDPSAFEYLRPWYTQLARSLLHTAKRGPSENALSLCSHAYEALSKLLCALPASAIDPFAETVEVITLDLLLILEDSLKVTLTDDIQQIQGHVAGCLSIACTRAGPIFELDLLQRLIAVLIQIALQYRRSQNTAVQQGQTLREVTVTEDSLEAMDCMNILLYANCETTSAMISDDSMNLLQQLVLDGIEPEQHDEYLKATIDLSRAFSSYLMARVPRPAAMEAISAQLRKLIDTLGNSQTPIEAKPLLIQVLGDIALVCGNPYFLPHVNDTLSYLEQAILAVDDDGDNDSEEWKAYVTSIRASVLGTYSSVLYSVQSPMREDVTHTKVESDLRERAGSVPSVLKFIAKLVDDPKTSDEDVVAAIGLAGDLILSFKGDLLKYMNEFSSEPDSRVNIMPFIQQRCMNSSSPIVQERAQWLNGVLSKFQ